jgi:hypothetical protein
MGENDIKNMVVDINDYIQSKSRKPEDVVQALHRLLDHYSEKVPPKYGHKPFGPLSRWLLERFTDKLQDARSKHEKLSLQFEKLKPLCAAEKVRSQMGDLCRDMQRVWEPFRELIGTCPHCNATRIAGTTEGFDGFGCPRCGELEKVTESKKKGK